MLNNKPVEVIAPIEDATARGRLWEILQVCMRDRRQAWDLRPDGTYVQRTPPEGATGPEAVGTQETLMQLTRQRLVPGSEARKPAAPSQPPEEAKSGSTNAQETEERS